MKDFKWVIRSNEIKDCPITIQDIDVATKIWGKNIATLKGKTTRSKMHPVASEGPQGVVDTPQRGLSELISSSPTRFLLS
jgi:hypothetical protein